ncbi:3-isopropylmalate dehydratase large subunit [Candidatus Methylacidiphilum fumarolicum]|uniref:3-isopropylmalate dehydratase n=2 Tax=Candidatus Methylacidiphilum fumarolicum TaxID=591154 RepID=I0JX77_METFB|nr:aconitase family protein [Candidatus Methylacidiphilum fumarolicum]MBW6415679.1 3-isopropylmalate dehydratase large subunit [Candidatus Methylacidiphilum fumarolicum]TFE67572.1 3-isopropylmalate dehydratase [Candidatus Methylacidiphilum fumarolicum]TFE71636.1 3-isopropylmalate dehydratase large subunit [Candidatus Methylacidiphilum fumarolicum]TFE73595.1 3-isopropylmalate dehydratase large subunit [Candidatus Methylacidiphilum fumarolicum]TFE75349.1 3-isopropylmalate dehydratase [Candidatus
MTLTEKILAKASKRSKVLPGDNIWVETDILLTHDVCGPGTIGVFKREFGKNARVWNPYKIVIMPDHYIFTSDSLSNRNVDILRAFSKEQGLPYFYDVIDDPNGNWKFDPLKGPLQRQYGMHYAGVCHTALPEKGHVRPGEVLFGTDSHTCTAGAFNQFATGIGNTDAGFVMGTGKLLIKVPPTIQFYLDGELQKGVMAKDLILYIIGEIGFDGATYMAMQFEGPGAFSLSIEDRMTMANMAIEAGAKNGIFPADQKTIDYVNQRILKNGTKKEFEVVELEKDQKFFASYSIDLSKIEPTVAAPPNPANRFKAKELASVKIDRAYLGSCTGGKLTDFIAFASILKNNMVSVETFAVPSTPEVVDQLHKIELEGQSLWEILVQAGVKITENPSCAACLGGPMDTFGRVNKPLVCISSTNRNFPGRMGDKASLVYLASPMTVAASAIKGKITDPREFL